MKITATCFLFCLFFSVFTAISAQQLQQQPDHRRGQMIVKLTDGASPEEFIARLDRQVDQDLDLKILRTIKFPSLAYLIGFSENYTDENHLLNLADNLPEVVYAQWNYLAQERNVTPNDPDWLQQADMSLIEASEAWSTSIGGVTPAGDTIVVAVVERGALYTHPDLAPNRWYNHQEIPNDGLDNDGNGYADDYGGWNPATQTDDMGNIGPHGTGVAGVIGAAGNNHIGVAGVNWNVKLLNISGAEDILNILDAYRYIYDMRKLYNDTNGAKGAFIVATNASFGFPLKTPDSSPYLREWCNLFDSLGVIGVLNMGATTNDSLNVEEVGDMPSTCESEFLITVTEVYTSGKHTRSGYGPNTVDLGAPGQGTYTTFNSDNTPSYSSWLNGTSAATPHVTGAVALLYSLGCEGFTGDALSDPAACARRVRDAILENTEPQATLKGKTVTGGYLNLKKAIDGVSTLCSGSVGPLSILEVRTLMQGNKVKLFYQTPIFLDYRFMVSNMLGQQVHTETLHPNQFSENYVEFDFSDFPRGVYTLSIGRGDAVVSVKFPKI